MCVRAYSRVALHGFFLIRELERERERELARDLWIAKAERREKENTITPTTLGHLKLPGSAHMYAAVCGKTTCNSRCLSVFPFFYFFIRLSRCVRVPSFPLRREYKNTVRISNQKRGGGGERKPLGTKVNLALCMYTLFFFLLLLFSVTGFTDRFALRPRKQTLKKEREKRRVT